MRRLPLALLLVGTVASADAVDVALTPKAELGKGFPMVHLTILEPIAGFRLKLKRSDGFDVDVKGGGKVGTRRDIELTQPEGKFGYVGELSINYKNAQTATMPLQFDAELWGPLHLKIDKKDVDLEKRTISFSLSRPVAKVRLKVLMDTGRPAFDGDILFNGEKENTRLEVGWPEKPGKVFKIAFRAFDTAEFHTGVEFFPWSIDIPHEEVNFESGKWDVRPQEEAKLDKSYKLVDEAVFKYGAFADVKLYVAGHTDTVAAKDFNRTLSMNRARAIASYFRRKGLRIPILYTGFGEDALLVQTADEVDEVRNRRAEYIIAVEDPGGKQTPVAPKWEKL